MVFDIHCGLGKFLNYGEASMEITFDETDVVIVLCPRCRNIGRNPKKCDSCNNNIPLYAYRTLLKANGNVFDLTQGFCVNYQPDPSRSQGRQKVRCRFKKPESAHNLNQKRSRPIRERYLSLLHGNRQRILETARSVIRQQQKKEKEETKEDRCSFGKNWKYCSRCNPQLQNGNKTHEGKCTKRDLEIGVQLTIKSMELSDTEDEEKVSLDTPEFMHHQYKFQLDKGEGSNIKLHEKRTDTSFMPSSENMGIKKTVGTYKSKGCFNVSPKTQGIGNIINNQKKTDDNVLFTSWLDLNSKPSTVVDRPESKDCVFIFPENENPLNRRDKLIKNMKLINITPTVLSSDTAKKDHLVNTTNVNQASSSVCDDQKETNVVADNLNSTKNDSRPPAGPSKFLKASSSVSADRKETNLVDDNLNLKNELRLPAWPSKFSKEPSSTSSHLTKSGMGAENLNSKPDENKAAVMLSSSKNLPMVSSNMSFRCKDRNMDTENINLMINESKTSLVPPNSIVSIKNHQFNKDTNKCDEVMEIGDENCQNKQLPQLLKYPSIHEDNLDCLAEGKDLNDIVIQFYLRYIFNEKLTPELQKKTYICDSLLCTRLLEGKEPAEDWLKDVDLFSKDFIVMPVNKKINPKSQGHWYLIIICNLSKLPKRSIYGNESEIEVCNIEIRDESETEVCDTEIQSVFQQKSRLCQLTDERPCICFFDSLDDSKELSKEKVNVTKNLIYFLKCLLLSKIKVCNPVKETYYWKVLRPLKVYCPQQTNEHDCGVFLLQFVESFFETPIANFQDELNVKQWFNQDMIGGKRKIIKEIIEERMAKK